MWFRMTDKFEIPVNCNDIILILSAPNQKPATEPIYYFYSLRCLYCEEEIRISIEYSCAQVTFGLFSHSLRLL